MDKEIKIVSKEDVLELFAQLLPWEKQECIDLLEEKYYELFPNRRGWNDSDF